MSDNNTSTATEDAPQRVIITGKRLPEGTIVGQKEGVCLFSHAHLDVPMQLPLPGIVIYVHGVNSDGEWFEHSENGLCAGLNDRLARNDDQLAMKGVEAGQMLPASYMPELTPEGYINPKLAAQTFIKADPSFSPVIRFRWGYKASKEDLEAFGDGIFLNEQNYWGGGPFANGCTTLPDLWGEGLNDSLFLWMHIQHMNPTNDRAVFNCPPRAYYVFHAWRLAKLVESIRRKQADVPITIVCHSQGNMVGIAAAFLGDRLPEVSDCAGQKGRCVADTYVLCNPPYSVVESNGADNWAQRSNKDHKGKRGRETLHARYKTLEAFFDIVRGRAGFEQAPGHIDLRMANTNPGAKNMPYSAKTDRDKWGLNGSTYGRVTLYCNPHDQVISATTVQGIGWRGMSAKDIEATKGLGVFTQRVFAQGFTVGLKGTYHYWNDQHNKPDPKKGNFWYPPSPPATFSLTKAIDANPTFLGKVVTVLALPLHIIINASTKALDVNINADPPPDWQLPIEAPELPEKFKPMAMQFGIESEKFDQGFDPPGEYRNANAKLSDDPNDPYNKATGMRLGNEQSEASLRYEHHAEMRMRARREGKVDKAAEHVEAEDNLDRAPEEYKQWRTGKLDSLFISNEQTHATDHSTIMTNPMHSRKALAYDVAVGVCDIQAKDLAKLRMMADWRFLDGLPDDDPHKPFAEYFKYGRYKEQFLHNWIKKDADASMPDKIVDERQGSFYLGLGSVL